MTASCSAPVSRPTERYLCFALRNWKGFADKAPLFGQAAKYAYETYGLTPVFTAVEKHLDPGAGRLAAAGLDIPHYFLDDAGNASTIIGALSRMRVVVSMRLHALIFAAGQGVPLAGVVYDPKVSAFLRYIGQENFRALDTLTLGDLTAMIDSMGRSACLCRGTGRRCGKASADGAGQCGHRPPPASILKKSEQMGSHSVCSDFSFILA